MSKLEKLSDSQVALVETVRDEWLSLFFSGKEIDHTTAQREIEWLYDFCNLQKPTVIFVDSPLGMQFAANMLKNGLGELKQVGGQVWDQVGDQVGGQVRDQVRDQVGGQVWDQVGDQVGGQVWDQVGGQVRGQVGDQVWDQVRGQVRGQVRDQVGGQVWDQVRDQVRGQVGDQVGGQVWDQVGDQVGGQVWDQVWDQVGGQVGDQVGGQVWDQVGDQVGGQMEYFTPGYWAHGYSDFGWLSFYDFFDRIGVKMDTENLYHIMSLIRSGVYDMIQLDGLCIVASLPSTVRRNTQNMLHGDRLPAIEWRDGFKLWYLNGVHFPQDMWEKVVSGDMPFQDILAIEDIDQRTQAMRYGNVWDFVKHAKGKKLDELVKTRMDGSPVKYWLYEFPKGDVFIETAYYAIYTDLVPGSDKMYMSGVEKSKTVAEAMAWKFSNPDTGYVLSPKEWLGLVPGLHMN